MADAARDRNRVPTLLGVSNVDGITAVPIKVNPATGALITEGGAVAVDWGTITGTLSAQTDLQTALNTKQNQLTGITDGHSKSLVNNSVNNIFSFPLADGEGIGLNISCVMVAKQGTDIGTDTFIVTTSLFNIGGVLTKDIETPGVAFSSIQTGAITGMGSEVLNSSLTTGVVTFTINPGNVATAPDSIVLNYVIINPTGKTLTFL